MAEDRIDSIIDLGAIGGEFESTDKLLDSLLTRIKSFEGVKVKFEGASGVKDLVSAQNELSSSTNAMAQAFQRAEAVKAKYNGSSGKMLDLVNKDIKASKEIAATKDKEAATRLKNAKAAEIEARFTEKISKEKARSEAAVLREIKNLEKLGNEYEQLKTKYTIAANTAKQLAVQELNIISAQGKESAAAKAAAQNTELATTAAKKYYEQLLKVETAVGQSQRQVGQYTQATFALTQVLREAPAFANSFSTGISAISNNVPILIDQFKLLRTEVGSGFKAFKILAGSLLSFGAILPIAFLLIQSYGKEIKQFFTGLVSGSKKVDELKESVKLGNKVIEESIKLYAKETTHLQILLKTLKDTTLTSEVRNKALKEYNEIADKGNRIDQKAIDNTPLIEASINRQIELIKERALARASETVIAERAEKLFIAQLNAREVAERQALQFERSVNQRNKYLNGPGQDTITFTLADREKNVKKFISQNKEVIDAQAELDRALKFGSFTPNQDKESGNQTGTENSAIKTARDTRKILFEIQKQLLQDQINNSQQIVSDEKESFNRRLDAAEAYYNAREKLITAQAAFSNEDNRLRAEEDKQQLRDKLKNDKLTLDQKRAINQAIISIDKEFEAQKLLTSVTSNSEIIQLNEDSEKQITDLLKQNLDERARIRTEYFKKVEADARSSFETQAKVLDINRDGELQELDKKFIAGKVKRADYESEKLEIQLKYNQLSIQNEIAYYSALLELLNLSADERRAIQLKIAELEKKSEKEVLQVFLDIIKKKEDAEKRLAELRKAFTIEAADTFKTFILSQYDKEKNEIQSIIDLLEERKQKDIEAANQTALSAQERADKIAVIEARANAQKEQLEKRKRLIDQQRAKFEKAASAASIIGETAKATFETTAQFTIAKNQALILASDPLTAAFAPAAFAAAAAIGSQIPFIIGAGALNLAKILAIPIPAYEKGTESAKPGLAIWGEKGRELMIDRAGQVSLSPATATLTKLAGGEKIIPADITKDILNANNLSHLATMKAHAGVKPDFINGQLIKAYNEQTQILKRIEVKPTSTITIIENQTWHDYVTRQIKS